MSKSLCPICEKRDTKPEFKPFCSKRCADVDLSRWLRGGYAIPGQAGDTAEDTPTGQGVDFDRDRP